MRRRIVKGWETEEIIGALRARYAAKEWAFFPQVPEGTGGGGRTADALVMSLWPSRGLELIGFEVKASRSDWLRELREPEKAEAICQFCDRWYIVTGYSEVVADGELPPTWGLLAPSGNDLVEKVKAPKLEPRPMDRLFLAALLRRASEYVVPKVEIKARLQRARDDGFQAGKDSVLLRAPGEARVHEELKAVVAAFEKASGIRIQAWSDGKEMGEALKATEHLLGDGWGTTMSSIEKIEKNFKEAAERIDKAKTTLTAIRARTAEAEPAASGSKDAALEAVQ